MTAAAAASPPRALPPPPHPALPPVAPAGLPPVQPPASAPAIFRAVARQVAPRKRIKVSEWADQHRRLSSKGSAKPGQWLTANNPPTREPMDCFTPGSTVRDVALMWPIQFAKTEVALNVIGATMCLAPCPIMVALPGEVTLNKWVAQKLHPMLEESPALVEIMGSTSSRDASNTRTFKDYLGGQLYLEHAGNPSRLKSTSVCLLVVDELDEVAANFPSGDDPMSLLDGRTSAFPDTYRRLYISSPQIKGRSRIEAKWLISDQRRYFVPCPHCGEEQHLEWSGLKWAAHRHPEHGRRAWYVCRACGAEIDEHHKTAMIAAGQWRATHPAGRIRGYHINCLYYQRGLGPRWGDLADMWLEALDDPAKLKVFVNDRLAEVWEDETTRRVKHEALADRAETYPLRTAPEGVLYITAGVDTQDNRLAGQLVGWGRGMVFWVLDYVELMGDPAEDAVWDALATWLVRPIQHARFGQLSLSAMWQDAGGHRTSDVYNFIRRARSRGIARPLCGFGSNQPNHPVLGRPKPMEVTWRGVTDKRGITITHCGPTNIKHWLFARLSADADRDAEHLQALQAEEAAARAEGRATVPIEPPVRLAHFSRDLPDMYFPGLTSEIFNPKTGAYEKKRGVRNEPLDTWGYAFAATHHPELRLHRHTAADWDRRELQLANQAAERAAVPQAGTLRRAAPTPAETPARNGTPAPAARHTPPTPPHHAPTPTNPTTAPTAHHAPAAPHRPPARPVPPAARPRGVPSRW